MQTANQSDVAARPSAPTWMVEHGKFRYYNAARSDFRRPPIFTIPFELQTEPNAIITPYRKSRMGATQTVAGAIYDGEGRIVADSIFGHSGDTTRRHSTDNPRHLNVAAIADAPRIKGRSIYLGVYRRHFGHFMLKSLARAWRLIELDPDVRLIYHGGDFSMTPYAAAMLKFLKIDPERFVDYSGTIVAEHLIVPNSQFFYNNHASPGMCAAFDAMRQNANVESSPEILPKRIYLTRRLHETAVAFGTAKKQSRWGKTRGLNEAEVEALFVARGFTVIAPEQLSVQDQIRLISRATHVAGLTGTALHSILFNADPDVCLIAIDGRMSMNQLLINGIRGVNAHHIFCARERTDAGWVIDLRVVAKALGEIL